MTENEKARFLDAAEKNNLIPCLFKVIYEDDMLNPVEKDGWNLFDLRDGKKIIPENIGTDERS